MMSGESESPISVASFDDAKTDFISVAVFDGGTVRGYLSFRVAFSIADAARTAEVGYLASDISIRRKLSLSDVSSNFPSLSKRFESDIKTQIEGKLPANLVEGVKVVDFGFDARI